MGRPVCGPTRVRREGDVGKGAPAMAHAFVNPLSPSALPLARQLCECGSEQWNGASEPEEEC